MAFRTHELNLIMRVQDRATTRLRRIANDLGGMQRASDMQRQGARLAESQNRNALKQATMAQDLQSRTLKDGAKNLQYQSRMNKLEADRLRSARQLASLDVRDPRRAEQLLRHAAIEQDMLRTKRSFARETRQLTLDLWDEQVAHRNIGKAIEDNEKALARALKQERAVRRARTTVHAGGASAMVGGLALVAMGGAASTFANFNRLTVGAATQMRGVDESFVKVAQTSSTLQTQLLDLTRQFPATADEMAQSAYDFASGMDLVNRNAKGGSETIRRYNQSMQLLKTANQVAVAGNLDLDTATDVVITTLNNFDPALKNVQGTMDTLFATVRFGKGTFADFAPQIGRVASAANAAGQSLAETGGALAFLSQRMPIGQAATALIRIFQIIGRTEFTTGFQELFGMSAFKPGTRQLKDLSDIMLIIEKQAPKIFKGFKAGSVDLMNVIQEVTRAGQNKMRGGDDAVGLVSTEFSRRAITNMLVFGKQYRTTVGDVMNTNSEFANSLKAFQETPGVRWQVAMNQFKAFAIVIGESVIPVMLRFIDWVNRVSQRFQDLSPRTRHLIGQFAAWGAGAMLVVGALASLVGGIGLIIAKLGGLGRLLGMSGTTGIVGRFISLLTVLRRIAAIGAIAIVLKTAWSGDPTAKDFLMGALGGAAAGSRFGPLGALVGGLTVPVAIRVADVMHNIRNRNQTPFRQFTNLKFEGQIPKDQSFDEWNKQRLAAQRAQNALNRAQKTGNKFKMIGGLDQKSIKLVVQRSNQAAENIYTRWKNLATDLTGVDLFGGLSQATIEKVALLELALSRAEAAGNKAGITSANQALLKWYNAEAKRLEKLPKTKANIEKLNAAYQKIAQITGTMTTADNKATAAATKKAKAAERERKARERATRAVQKAQEKVQRLQERIKTLREEIGDKLRSVMGSVFQGPLMQGPIGGVFTNIASTLAGVGKSFAIPADFILRDQQAQMDQFKMMTSDLDWLSKRGVGRKTIQDILSQGTAALPMLEGIRQGTPAQQNQFIKNLKDQNSAIAKALESPWQKQITASNTQLKAAQMQLAAAKKAKGEKVGAAKKVNAPVKKGTAGQTRTPQGTHIGDVINVNAVDPTGKSIAKAINKTAFNRRNRK